MFRNNTLKQSSFLVAAALSLFNAVIIVLLVFYVQKEHFSIQSVIITVIACILGSYILYQFLIQKTLLGRIRVIYKILENPKESIARQSQLMDLSVSEIEDDVTAWAERSAVAVNQIMELEEYRKNFVGNVSHELKTPIFAIQGYLITLLEGGIHDEKINLKYLQKAMNNVDRLQNIVDDLETIYQLESDQIILDIQDFDLNNLCHEVADDLRFQADDKGIDIVIGKPREEVLKASGDKERVRHVLYNLITNALKYGRKGGSTWVEFDVLNDKITIAIKDDGIGIDERHLQYIFDRFYRVESSRSRKGGGSGLGLSIVKHIIEAHAQTITVVSNKGEGSTFRFTLNKA